MCIRDRFMYVLVLLPGKRCEWRIWMETCPWWCLPFPSQPSSSFCSCWYRCSAGIAYFHCDSFGNHRDVVHRVCFFVTTTLIPPCLLHYYHLKHYSFDVHRISVIILFPYTFLYIYRAVYMQIFVNNNYRQYKVTIFNALFSKGDMPWTWVRMERLGKCYRLFFLTRQVTLFPMRRQILPLHYQGLSSFKLSVYFFLLLFFFVHLSGNKSCWVCWGALASFYFQLSLFSNRNWSNEENYLVG